MRLLSVIGSLIRQNVIKSSFIILCGTNLFILLHLGLITKVTHIIHYNTDSIGSKLCYDDDVEIDDDLPDASIDFNPAEKSIYFLEASCRGDLDSREACAVESAIRAHPKWEINVLFAGVANTLSLRFGTLMKLSMFKNVNLRRIHIGNYAKGTPLYPIDYTIASYIVASGGGVQQFADVLKYLTLYKWGGIYLDLDVMVMKPLDNLGSNWAIRRDDNSMSAGLMSLSKNKVGRNISRITIREFQIFRPDEMYYSGDRIITRALQKSCTTKKVREMSADTCRGFQVYGPKNFFPIHRSRCNAFFEPREIKRTSEVYTYYMWNNLTRGVRVPKDSFYANLAKNYCPSIYSMFGDEFGNI